MGGYWNFGKTEHELIRQKCSTQKHGNVDFGKEDKTAREDQQLAPSDRM